MDAEPSETRRTRATPNQDTTAGHPHMECGIPAPLSRHLTPFPLLLLQRPFAGSGLPSDDPKHVPPSTGQWEPHVPPPAQEMISHPSRLKIATSFAMDTAHPDALAELAPISPAHPAHPDLRGDTGKGPAGCGHLLRALAAPPPRDAGSARPHSWPEKGCTGPSPGGIWEDNGPGDAADSGEDGTGLWAHGGCDRGESGPVQKKRYLRYQGISAWESSQGCPGAAG